MPVILNARLIRDSNRPEKDDRVTVRRQDNNLKVTYYDADAERKYELLLTNTSLGTYVRHLCCLFKTDIDPFDTIQFNFNGFPMYLAKRDSLTGKVARMLEDIAGIAVESEFADDPSDIYEDMPPLTPLNRTQSFNNYNY
jgi:hypothetical protein